MSKILLTGASGRLGTHLRTWFAAAGRAVLCTDIVQPEDGTSVEIADLSDRAAVDRLMSEDISAVVHFGGMAKEAGWQTILDANIVGAYNVFDAARTAGVRRIVYASSYHVLGMYPTVDAPLGIDASPRPDTLYGVSKIFGEALGRLYYDKFGIECLAIRICTAGMPNAPREFRLWCNRDDLARLIDRGLDMPALGYRTVFGISANHGAFYVNQPDPELGWHPEHSSSELPSYTTEALDSADPRNRLLGGIFAQWPHFDDRTD
jgi:uronate dehydrogenase